MNVNVNGDESEICMGAYFRWARVYFLRSREMTGVVAVD